MNEFLSNICDAAPQPALQPRPVSWFEPLATATPIDLSVPTPAIGDGVAPILNDVLDETPQAADSLQRPSHSQFAIDRAPAGPVERRPAREVSSLQRDAAGGDSSPQSQPPTGVNPTVPESTAPRPVRITPTEGTPGNRREDQLSAGPAALQSATSGEGLLTTAAREQRHQQIPSHRPSEGIIAGEGQPSRKGRHELELLQIRARLSELEQSLHASGTIGDWNADQPIESGHVPPSAEPKALSGSPLSSAASHRANAIDDRSNLSRAQFATAPAADSRIDQRDPQADRASIVASSVALPAAPHPPFSPPPTVAPLPQIAIPEKPPSASATQPSVRISIGRIQVVGTPPQRTRREPAPAARPQYVMSLEDYLNRRAAGRTG